MTAMSLEELIGPVGMMDYAKATKMEQARIQQWAPLLPTLDEDAFFDLCVASISEAVVSESERRTAPEPYIRAYACLQEAKRRYAAEGHQKDCQGDNLYQRAYNKSTQMYGLSSSDPSPCTCGAEK